MASGAITVWSISDGRPGHWTQVRGLIEALTRRVRVRECVIDAPSRLRSAVDLVRRRWPETDQLPDPDLIVGAGHATHLPMLTAARRRGGRTILLMRSTFPVDMFDLCLIPEIQVESPHPRIIPTRGALNRITAAPRTAGEATHALMLLGGPSRHVRWNTTEVVRQVREVAASMPGMNWLVSSSRRTPPDVLAAIDALCLPDLKTVDGCETPADWLPAQLQDAGVVWVTADSISMIYESLTAGAAVGVIEVPVREADGKISRSLRALEERRDITLFSRWVQTRAVKRPESVFNEADRCAEAIVQRFELKPRVAA